MKESFCCICHRSEQQAGPLLTMIGEMKVCHDCMERSLQMFSGTFPTMPTMDFAGTQKKQESVPAEEPKKPAAEKQDDEPKTSPEEPEKAPEEAPEEPQEKEETPTNFLEQLMKELGNPMVFMTPGNGMKLKNAQDHKKKQKKAPEKPPMTLKDLPAPHELKKQLDEYVVGQEQAKKVISVAVYNHYKRVLAQDKVDVEIQKSNMLMIGPTGCGKTYLVQTLAKLLDVPLALADATSLTEAGYIGDDVESVLSKLLAAADGDVEKAERGIVFIDEIDKLAKKKNTSSRDVSGESVQQGLLKLLEGSEVEIPVGANSKNAMVPLTTINTRNILFICGGAFPELANVIKERLQKTSLIGFGAELKDTYEQDANILDKVTTEDLRGFGMIPEFLGRLPIVFTLQAMSRDTLVRILTEPKNAIVRQYQALLSLDEVKLDFTEDALEWIAEQAMKKDIGARALRAIIEEYMLDIMYEIPKDDNIGSVTITRDYLEHKGGPQIAMRG